MVAFQRQWSQKCATSRKCLLFAFFSFKKCINFFSSYLQINRFELNGEININSECLHIFSLCHDLKKNPLFILWFNQILLHCILIYNYYMHCGNRLDLFKRSPLYLSLTLSHLCLWLSEIQSSSLLIGGHVSSVRYIGLCLLSLTRTHYFLFLSALIVWSRAWVKGMLQWLSVRVEGTLGRWNIYSGGPLELSTAITMLGNTVPLYIYC